MHKRRWFRRWRSNSGLLLAALVGFQCHQAMQPLDTPASVAAERIYSSGVVTSRPSVAAELARRDPEAFLGFCLDQYDLNVRDYTCTFRKQEEIGGKIGEPEEIAIRFREDPYSVDMKWVKNAGQAQRALYVAEAWKNGAGEEQAWIKPAGAVIKLFVPKLLQPIHGRRARSVSRRSIDQFGFRRTLDLIIKYTDRGRVDGVLDLRYVGEGTIHERPTFVFERYLPYSGSENPYPDALLRYHIDQEWLVPTGCFSYADAQGQQLLGAYVLTDVRFNVDLAEEHFDPKALGF